MYETTVIRPDPKNLIQLFGDYSTNLSELKKILKVNRVQTFSPKSWRLQTFHSISNICSSCQQIAYKFLLNNYTYYKGKKVNWELLKDQGNFGYVQKTENFVLDDIEGRFGLLPSKNLK